MVHAGTPHQKEFPLCRVASERIIVRASNPGQFEPDGPDGGGSAGISGPWQKGEGDEGGGVSGGGGLGEREGHAGGGRGRPGEGTPGAGGTSRP